MVGPPPRKKKIEEEEEATLDGRRSAPLYNVSVTQFVASSSPPPHPGGSLQPISHPRVTRTHTKKLSRRRGGGEEEESPGGRHSISGGNGALLYILAYSQA
jgi:hypothetical protein